MAVINPHDPNTFRASMQVSSPRTSIEPPPEGSSFDAAVAALLEHGGASIVSDGLTDQRFLIVPLPGAGVGSVSTANYPGVDPSGLAAGVSLLREGRHDRQQLEAERDALADQVGQNFEELHWLHQLATVVSASDATSEVRMVAGKVLRGLRDLIRAEAVVFLPMTGLETDQTVWVGHDPIGRDELARLKKDLDLLSPDGSLVFNRESDLRQRPLETTARNVVAVPLLQRQTRYGWLIALNRVAPSSPGDEAPTDLLSGDFGSHEVGLLMTAAGMLAGHARNVELFRAEEDLRISVIETITEALDARDPNTCGHSRRVGQHAARIAEYLGHSPEECERIYITGLLHDVGKIGIPDNILKKADRLTDDEFEVIKQHPAIGYTILSPLKGLAYALPGVLHHHERFDGRGYPHGLSGYEIPWDARVLAVADSYDAMTSNRTYRDGMGMDQAIEILLNGAGQQWDADAVTAFVAIQQENGGFRHE